MFQFFKINQYKRFKIENFSINKPLIIKTEDDKFLSIDEVDNKVFFDKNEKFSNTQKWIIEKDENFDDVFYFTPLKI